MAGTPAASGGNANTSRDAQPFENAELEIGALEASLPPVPTQPADHGATTATSDPPLPPEPGDPS